MQAAAAAALYATGRRRQRFFNAALLGGPVYSRCLLPAFGAAAGAPHVAPASIWTCTRRATHGYHHDCFSPPPALAAALAVGGPSWSAPFAQFLTPPPPSAAPPPPVEAEEDDPDTPPPEKRRKKTRPFQRAKPVEGHLRTVAIRMWPTKLQRVELLRAFAMARNAFNFATEVLRQEGRGTLGELRKRWAQQPRPAWDTVRDKERVPVMFQARAIQDRVTSLKTNVSMRRKDPTLPPFELRFRSARRTPTEVLHIEKDYESKAGCLHFEPAPPTRSAGSPPPRRGFAECLAVLGGNFKRAERGILLQDHARFITRLLAEGAQLKEEAKLRWDKRVHTFHLLYTYELPRLPDPDPTFQTKRVVACDPGCQPFQAWYAPGTGEHGALLVGGTEALMRRCYDLDRRCGRLARIRPGGGRTHEEYRRRKRRMRRGLARERARLRGWVQDAHYDAANTLLRRFDLILQPQLEVQELTLTATRNISSRTARAMLTWSHSMYAQRLQSKALRVRGPPRPEDYGTWYVQDVHTLWRVEGGAAAARQGLRLRAVRAELRPSDGRSAQQSLRGLWRRRGHRLGRDRACGLGHRFKSLGSTLLPRQCAEGVREGPWCCSRLYRRH